MRLLSHQVKRGGEVHEFDDFLVMAMYTQIIKITRSILFR